MATAQQDVQVSVGKDFVIMGDDRVEVSPDGKKITAYASNGVETKAAAGDTAAAPGISISADFNTVVLNGVTIERAADGHLVISAPGGTVLTKQRAPANDTAVKSTEPQAGDRIDNGTICAGISPDTGKPFFAAAADESLTMTWKDAMKDASKSTVHGISGWRLPTRAELNVMYENKSKGALKGTFNETGSNPAGWYWSSTENDGYFNATGQRFSDGDRRWFNKTNRSSVRLVRS